MSSYDPARADGQRRQGSLALDGVQPWRFSEGASIRRPDKGSGSGMRAGDAVA